MQVIAIAGGTASGKTTVTNQILNTWSEYNIVLLSMDHYYLCLKQHPPEERAAHNFDDPASLDARLFIEQVQMLRQGKAIEAPQYDFKTHTRLKDTVRIEAGELLLLDGILLLHFAELRSLCDLKVFIDAPDSLRLQRRILRDVKERGRSEEAVLSQWQTSVQPMFEQFVHPSMTYADIILYGQSNLAEQVENLRTTVHQLIPPVM